MFFYTPYDILLIPAIILSLWAQIAVSSAYKRYSQIGNKRGITGSEAARKILDINGLQGVKIERVNGQLSDHYDPKSNTIRLSDGVYANGSIAAVGIAAHEAGHALQHDTAYAPIRLRNGIFPVVRIASTLSWPLLFLGIILSMTPLVTVGIFLFSGVVAFQLITLPVEFDASRRAISAVYEMGMLSEEETGGVKKILRAAALTYIAAAATSLLQLLRLLMIAGGGRRRN